MQKGKPVAHTSRSLTGRAQFLQKELLAIVFACSKIHQFIDDTPCKDFGSNETNYVDWHQPESHSSQQGQKTVKLGWLKECL